LVEEKGIDLLLEAAAQLPGDWRVRIVGSGPLRAELGHLAQSLCITERVTFIDWIASTEMPQQYAEIDVLVLPSLTRPNWKEQFGRVLVEAMASARPVIGSDSGAIPGVIGNAGLVFPEGDVLALTEQLHTLQSKADLRLILGDIGRRRVLEHFTHERIAEMTVGVYQEICATNPAPD
jgi:glycosyltransferase involved in cell wall biosynthesis